MTNIALYNLYVWMHHYAAKDSFTLGNGYSVPHPFYFASVSYLPIYVWQILENHSFEHTVCKSCEISELKFQQCFNILHINY